jgi:hypothetical protein
VRALHRCTNSPHPCSKAWQRNAVTEGSCVSQRGSAGVRREGAGASSQRGRWGRAGVVTMGAESSCQSGRAWHGDSGGARAWDTAPCVAEIESPRHRAKGRPPGRSVNQGPPSTRRCRYRNEWVCGSASAASAWGRSFLDPWDSAPEANRPQTAGPQEIHPQPGWLRPSQFLSSRSATPLSCVEPRILLARGACVSSRSWGGKVLVQYTFHARATESRTCK